MGVLGVVALTGCGAGASAAPRGGEDATSGDAQAAEGAVGASADASFDQGMVGQGEAAADSPGADVDAGAPSDAAIDWTFLRPSCGGYDSGAGCSADEAATLSSPRVVGGEGGALSPGRDATVSVILTASDAGTIPYPCIGFAADNPGVSFVVGDAGVAGGLTNPEFLGSYVLPAGGSAIASLDVRFAASIPHGTVIRFAAWADSLNSACPNGAKIEWDVTLP